MYYCIANSGTKAIVKHLAIRLPQQELEVLKAYCEQEGRTQSEVLREYIRSLKRKIKGDNKD
jgi:predicted DNA-binding protein